MIPNNEGTYHSLENGPHNHIQGSQVRVQDGISPFQLFIKNYEVSILHTLVVWLQQWTQRFYDDCHQNLMPIEQESRWRV